MALEVRSFTGAGYEARTEGDDMVIAGYGALFDTPANISTREGQFTEIVARSAFNKTLQEAEVHAYFEHDPNKMLGSTSSGSLELDLDSRGLFYTLNLPDTTAGNDVYQLVKRGDIDSSSFGFRKIQDRVEKRSSSDELPVRTLIEVALNDVGPVVRPAYTETTVSVRSLNEQFEKPQSRIILGVRRV